MVTGRNSSPRVEATSSVVPNIGCHRNICRVENLLFDEESEPNSLTGVSKQLTHSAASKLMNSSKNRLGQHRVHTFYTIYCLRNI
jgi:hypothetical protein